MERRALLKGAVLAGASATMGACAGSPPRAQDAPLAARSPTDILRKAPPMNLDRAYEVMERERLDGIVVMTPVNVYHMTGYWPASSRMTNQPNLVAMLSRDAARPIGVVSADFTYYYLLSDHGFDYPLEHFLYAPGSALNVFADGGFAPLTGRERQRQAAVDTTLAKQAMSGNRDAALIKALRALGLDRGRIAVDDEGLKAALSQSGLPIDVTPAERALQRIRLVKSPREIELMRIAAEANAAAVLAAADSVRAGASYREMRATFYAEAARRGNRGVFMVIDGVSIEIDAPFRDGQALLVDGVSEGAGYHGDFARTIFIGEPSRSMQPVAAAIELGWSAVRDALRPGMRFSQITELGRATLRQAGYDYLVAFGPHSVGLYHTDSPTLGDIVLEENMVISVDCPVIQAGVGGTAHLEDLTRITSTGSEPIHAVSDTIIRV